MQFLKQFKNGLFKENALFVLVLGLCAALATTTSAKNGFFMALATTFVIVCSNAIISLVRYYIPNGVRIPCFIIIIASFVMMVESLMNAFAPQRVVQALGIFIPLIVVNCVPLARVEAYASKNNLMNSIADGLGVGAGYTMGLVLVSAIRELIGNGSFWEIPVTAHVSANDMGALVKTPAVMVIGPGAFMTLGVLFAFFKWRRIRRDKKAGEALVASAVPWEVAPAKNKESGKA